MSSNTCCFRPSPNQHGGICSVRLQNHGRKKEPKRHHRRTGGKHTMQAMLQISVLAPHFAPRITSGERYCRVWMSLVKWWPTQQAFPRSAIFTEMISPIISSTGVWSRDFLSNEIPDTSLSNKSLNRKPTKAVNWSVSSQSTSTVGAYVRSLFSLLLLFIL